MVYVVHSSELMKIEERATKIFLEKPYWAYFCPYCHQGKPPCTNGHEEGNTTSGLRRKMANFSR